MRWKEKLPGATIIFEILIVAPLALLGGGVNALLSQMLSHSFDYSWIAPALIIVVLNGFYGMGLLLIMGFIDFARRPRNDPVISNKKWIGRMEVGHE